MKSVRKILITFLQLNVSKNGKVITGKIPRHAFVAMRTDWSKRWPDADKMANKDRQGVAHYPGWSLPALKFLYEQHGVTAIRARNDWILTRRSSGEQG